MVVELYGGPDDGDKTVIQSAGQRTVVKYQVISPEHSLKHVYRVKAVGGQFKAVYEQAIKIERSEQ